MLGRSLCFLCITSTFLWGVGKCVLLKDTSRRPEWVSNPRPLDPESEVLTTRPPRPLGLLCFWAAITHKLPGIADHDAVLSLKFFFIKAQISKQKPRLNMFLYKKADWEGLEKHMLAFQRSFLSTCEGR